MPIGKKLTIRGIKFNSLREACIYHDKNYARTRHRIFMGMSATKALFTPNMKNVFIKAFTMNLTLAEWSRKTGLSRITISHRINVLKMHPEIALTKKTKKGKISKL